MWCMLKELEQGSCFSFTSHSVIKLCINALLYIWSLNISTGKILTFALFTPAFLCIRWWFSESGSQWWCMNFSVSVHMLYSMVDSHLLLVLGVCGGGCAWGGGGWMELWGEDCRRDYGKRYLSSERDEEAGGWPRSWKQNFSSCQNNTMSSAFWSVSGILLQSVGTALQNDLVPEGFLFGFSLNPEMAEEQREQGGLYMKTSTCRYCGTISCTQWYVRERVLYSVHLEMGNQCRAGRTGVIIIYSQGLVPVTIEAAAFWIFCRWFC